MVEIGDHAPDFELPDQDRRPVRLSSFRGRPVLLVFYPLTFTPVCEGELCRLRDELAGDVQVLAVSVDNTPALKRWSEEQQWGFPLLADFWPHGAVAQAYGVLDEAIGLPRRATFLVDAEGLVRWKVVNGLDDARDLDEYRQALAAL